MNKTKITYSAITDPNNLLAAAKNCMHGVTWKFSTQAYYLDRLARVTQASHRLKNHERMSEGFICFKISERGKTRDIRSVHINERVVQKCLCDYALLPTVVPRLILDNYATLKDRGTALALKRIKRFLQEYYRKYGTNKGYISIYDLHDYFNSIPHEALFEDYKRLFRDEPELVNLTMDFIDAFGEGRSLGLGSEVSQVSAALAPSRAIDHYVKEQLHIRWYGRYNDDSVMISNDLEYLKKCNAKVEYKYNQLGITYNKRKSHIRRIDKGFEFLKVKIRLTETGKVIMRPNRKNITRERRKLKALKKKCDAGIITIIDCKQQYGSWRGQMTQLNSYRTLQNMDKLFKELFHEDWRIKNHGKFYNIRFKRDEDYRPIEFPKRQAPAERRHRVGGCT